MKGVVCVCSFILVFLSGGLSPARSQGTSPKPTSKEVIAKACIPWGIKEAKRKGQGGQSEMAAQLLCQIVAGTCAENPRQEPCRRSLSKINKEMQKGGDSLLFQAAFIGDVPLAEVMIDLGADVHYRTGEGWTPLMISAAEGSEEVALLLIKHGAEVNAKNKLGRTPLMFAAGSGFDSIVEALLGNGASPDERPEDADGWPAIIAASYNGHAKVVELLLDKGADPSVQDKNGNTALMWAERQGHAEIVEILSRVVE